MNLKKFILLFILCTGVSFAKDTIGLIGLFSGSSDQDYKITVGATEKSYSSDDTIGLFRIGAIVDDIARAYLETYTLSNDNEFETIALNSANFDIMFAPEKALIKPVIGVSIMQRTYTTTKDNTEIDVETTNFGLRGAIVLNIMENLEFEAGALQYYGLTEPQTDSSNTDADKRDSTWYYFGLSLKFESLGKYISVN